MGIILGETMKYRVTSTDVKEFFDQISNVKYYSNDQLTYNYTNTISTLFKKCKSFTEFGVQQGQIIAWALLCKVPKIRGYDISISEYEYMSDSFNEYAKQYNIDYKFTQADTATCPVIESTDMLHIDSMHNYTHAIKELSKHGNQVQKYILMHDTVAVPGLLKAATEFVEKNKKCWKLQETYNAGVGYTLLERIK